MRLMTGERCGFIAPPNDGLPPLTNRSFCSNRVINRSAPDGLAPVVTNAADGGSERLSTGLRQGSLNQDGCHVRCAKSPTDDV